MERKFRKSVGEILLPDILDGEGDIIPIIADGDDGELELELEFDNDNELLDEISEDWEVTMFNTTQLELQDGADGPVLRFQKL